MIEKERFTKPNENESRSDTSEQVEPSAGMSIGLKLERSRKGRKFGHRKPDKGCLICGGTAVVAAIDNFGLTYTGCATCRIAKPDAASGAARFASEADYLRHKIARLRRRLDSEQP